MPTVELIYDRDCPNVPDARAQLLRAFAETGLPPRWEEWDRSAPESPVHVRHYGSPTILINGHDVAGASPSRHVDCCRLYEDRSRQLSGVPSTETIASALTRAKERVSPSAKAHTDRSGWRTVLAELPAIGAAGLPLCPACWPAYAGLLSSLGLGGVNYARYLLPLTTGFLILAAVSLGYRAQTRRGYKPLALGSLAAILVIVGKFIMVSDVTLYSGVVLLVGASLWNVWPLRRAGRGSCPACIPAGSWSEDKGMQIISERRKTYEK